MICELLSRSSGQFSYGFLRPHYANASREQLFAQMCHAPVRMSRAKPRLFDHVVDGRFKTATFNTCKYRCLQAKLQPQRILHGRSVERAKLAPGWPADRWTGRARVLRLPKQVKPSVK